MPAALWIGPTVNRSTGAMREIFGLVLHIQQGTEGGTEAWERDPDSHVSSHFLAPKTGGVRQMIDTDDMAWCQVAGNLHWLSVECEGSSGQQLTAGQVVGCAQILAWAHDQYGVPLRRADDPQAASVAAGGLIYHAAGGVAWGNHPDCPGEPVIAQRDDIIGQALSLTAEGSGDMTPEEHDRLVNVDMTCNTLIRMDPSAVLTTGSQPNQLAATLQSMVTALTAMEAQLAAVVSVPSAADIAREIILQLTAPK